MKIKVTPIVSKGQENCVEFFMRAGLCFGPSNKGGFMKKFIFIYLIAFSLVSAFTLKTSYACDEHKKARYHDSEVNTKMEEKYDFSINSIITNIILKPFNILDK